MIFLFYNTLLTLLVVLSTPYFLLRALFQEEFRRSLTERLGFYETGPFGSSIWIHAASVGEVFCSIPLLKRIKTEFPHRKIIMTTMTSTGRAAATGQLPEVDHILFLPIDHPFVLRKALKRIQPMLLLVAETELWPNLLRTCGRGGIPIILFNGRISEKSFRGYFFFRSLFRECLQYVSLFLMQTNEDRDRIVQIGAAPDKTRVVGNLKFDQTPPAMTDEATAGLAQSLGLVGRETVFIAGSTHSGEEEVFISLSKELREIAPDLLLILAPRHLNRLEEVEQILHRESSSWTRRTTLAIKQSRPDQQGRTEVILLDTMGELMSLYRLATLVFIGGSLVPVGGHNPLEPLFFKKCVLFGPFMFHFSEISRQLVEAGGAIQVNGREDLSNHLRHLLRNKRARNEIGERGYQFVRKHQGATERMLGEIRPYLA